MKSQRRHELKSNELVEFIDSIPGFFRDNAKLIIYVTVVVVAVVVVGYLKYYQRREQNIQRQIRASQLLSKLPMDKLTAVQAAASNQDISGRILETASSLEKLAEKGPADQLSALALIKQAEALRAELHYRPTSLEPQAVRQQIDRAEKLYEKALQLTRQRNNDKLAAMAKLGLGLCAEEIGEYDRAKQIYTEITETPEYEGTVFPPQAKRRLEIMDDFKDEVYFAAAPEPQEPELAPVVEQPILPDAEESLQAPPAAPNQPGAQLEPPAPLAPQPPEDAPTTATPSPGPDTTEAETGNE